MSNNSLTSARDMQVAANLALYLAERGESMLACQLHQYYDGNPGHREVINKVPAFCKEHPGLLTYTPDGAGGKLSLPRHCCLFLQKSCAGKHGHQGLLHVDLPAGAVHCQCGKQCPVGHWKQIEAQAKGGLGKGKGKSNFVPKLPATATNDVSEATVLAANGKGVGPTEHTSMSAAAAMALFIHGRGGVVAGAEMGDFYNLSPHYKEVIKSIGFKEFCTSYDGLFSLESGPSGQIRLASYCCWYLRDCCTKKQDHGSKCRHAKPNSGVAICNFGPKCAMGHWKQVLDLAAGIPRKPAANVAWMPTAQVEDEASVAKGKGKGKHAPLSAAATLALFVHRNGGVISGGNVSEYYKLFPQHKEIILSVGFKEFCTSYDGFFAFEPGEEGKIRLASHCCMYLRDCCSNKKTHGGKLHSKPKCVAAICSFGSKCTMGHWKQVLDLAAGVTITANVAGIPKAPVEDMEVPVSGIRWCHNSLRVIFRDGRLVAMMLKELLDGSLLVGQIPKFEVYEDDGILYAWTGNRRLWVLKEFEGLTGRKITVRVKKKVGKLPKQSPKYTTTTHGESVTFFTQNYEDQAFPSMGFALAALCQSAAPSIWDVELGRVIRSSNYACPMYKVEPLAPSLTGIMPGGDLKEYLLRRRYLFSVARALVDDVVQLANPIEAMKHLEGDLPAAAAVLDSMGEDGNGGG